MISEDFCTLTGKRRYPSRSDATRANHGIHKRGFKSNKAVTAYRCRHCGAWHLGRERS